MDRYTPIDETNGAYYPVRPEHINASVHFWNAFGNSETEISANWIVRFAQKLGGWKPFSAEQIETFYNESGHRGFSFNRLLDGSVVRKFDDGMYRVTHDFICLCFGSAPADLKPQTG